ncbi:MAG: phytoene desaturase, partial [Pseudohongiellaceae bacterium]
GSGFGGLAAALRLLARGYRVTVCEQLDAPGGRAYVYRQDGFTFDAGPTIVTAPFLLEDLWALFGKKLSDDVQLIPVDPYYRIRFADGSHFEYSGDVSAMKAEIARFCPADVAHYDRFLKASQRLYEVGFDQLLYESFDSPWKMLKCLPDLFRTRVYSTVFRMVKSFFSDPRLQMVFSFHPLLIGGNPMTTTAIYLLIAHLERSHGVHYAMGGTGSIINAMVKLIEAQGGVMRYNSQVQEILLKNGRASGVRLAVGETLDADMVVSNADAAATYRYLLPEQYRRRWTNRKLARTHYSMSLFVWYFGTKRQYPEVPHHMILLGPRYGGLLKDIFKRKVLAEDFSLYLHRPTASDPGMAPEGCDAFYVLSPVPNLQAGIDWRKQAEPYRQAIEQHLAATVLPDLKENVVTSLMLTPQEFQDRLGSVAGAAFSFEPRLTQTAWFRPHNISEEVPGLYLVGAGTHPGAGLPGVISSAKVLDNLLAERERRAAR